MVSIEQVKRGFANFVDHEIVPVMPKWKGILFAAGAPLVIEQKAKELPGKPHRPGAGGVRRRHGRRGQGVFGHQGEGQREVAVEISNFKMNEADFDKLYQYIKEA